MSTVYLYMLYIHSPYQNALGSNLCPAQVFHQLSETGIGLVLQIGMVLLCHMIITC